MPIRSSAPKISAQVAAEKIARKLDREVTNRVYRSLLMCLVVGHFVLHLLIVDGGLMAYLNSLLHMGRYLLQAPYAAGVLLAALIVLYQGVKLWRHPDPGTVVLPAFPPVEDLRWRNEIYLGSGYTRDGKQPGDVLLPDDELMDSPHVILTELGLFGNLHVKGGVGGGKTSTLIMPFLSQAIGKFPKPPLPSEFSIGRNGRFKSAQPAGKLSRLAHGKSEPRAEGDVPMAEDEPWEPYTGMTIEEATAEYERLLHEHNTRKWGMFVIDPKGDMTDHIRRRAALAGRLDDVEVLRPDGPKTVNPLAISSNPLVQAETVMDGIEAVSGQTIQQYWRQVQSEWLANALTILRVVDPTRVTFRSILRMARSEQLRVSMVADAEAIMRQAQEEEERLRRLGKPYTGVRVNPAAIEFFRDFDDPDADVTQKRAVVSAIKAQAKFFVDDDLVSFLCPEMPPTFEGFEAMIDKGKIVVLQMPLDQFGQVAKVLGILMLADAQQAARRRINSPDMNQERVVCYVVDEFSAYLNRLTKDFVAMNRQSRVPFLAAHQSQVQLIQQSDRSIETAMNDNLRTKISYSTPNADAAKRETIIYGGRRVYRPVWSESTNFSRVERQPDVTSFKPVGGESQGASVRWDEVERSWFEAEHFMALKTGESIVMEFDGTTTVPPRKIVAPAYYKSRTARLANEQPLPPSQLKPHPVVVVRPGTRDYTYLDSALGQTGYVIIEPLANKDGELAGFKFTTDVGTVIADCDLLDSMREILQERLCEPQTLIVLTDIATCAAYFTQGLGVRFERVLGLLDAHAAIDGVRPESFRAFFNLMTGTPPAAPSSASWDWHRQPENLPQILDDSRRLTKAFQALGDRLWDLGDEALEQLYEETRQRLDDGDFEPEGGPPPDGPEGTEPSEYDGSEMPSDEVPEWIDEPSPYASSSYPEELAEMSEGNREPAALPGDPDPDIAADSSPTEASTDADTPVAAAVAPEPDSSASESKPERVRKRGNNREQSGASLFDMPRGGTPIRQSPLAKGRVYADEDQADDEEDLGESVFGFEPSAEVSDDPYATPTSPYPAPVTGPDSPPRGGDAAATDSDSAPSESGEPACGVGPGGGGDAGSGGAEGPTDPQADEDDARDPEAD